MSDGKGGDHARRAKDLFLEVRTLPTAERAARLDERCAGDASLRSAIDALLHEHETAAETRPSAPVWKTSAGPATMPFPEIDAYRIVRELGRGGMGVVYLAERSDERIRRRVAIKVLKRGMDTEDVLRRFELERQLLAALNHPGIARLYDAGETADGLPYFVMEHVDGLELETYCDANRLRIPERLELFSKVCAAVHYAHQNLIVHRDLKPSNIIVDAEGQPKLLDFGIAKLLNPQFAIVADITAPEARVMTPEYASPEQVRGEPVSTASDVYSLGVVLYKLLSGRRPYRFRTRLRDEVVRVICEEEPERPSTAISRAEEPIEPDDPTTGTITAESVSRTRESRPERLRKTLSGDIDNIVLKAMRKEPKRRYHSAEQLAEDIRRHMDGLPVIARPDTLSYRATKFVGRHRLGVAAAIVIAVLLVGGAAGTTWGWQRAEAERDVAERRFDQVRSIARAFMFDFHDSIQELDGALPARELLVTNALEYLDGLAAEVGDHAELKRELAAGYDHVGDLRGGIRNPSLGDLDGALESYREALSLRTALVAASPDDAALRAELSNSHTKLGDVWLHRGDAVGALAAYQSALTIDEALLAASPTDTDARQAVAVALGNVAAALVRTGDTASAVEHYERSLAVRKKLAAERPDDVRVQRGLSVTRIRVGYELAEAGRPQAALDQFTAALRIRKRLAEADPESGRRRRDVAIAQLYVAEAELDLGRPEAALPHGERFLATATRRAADNPTSARAQGDLAVAHELVGRISATLGDADEARRQIAAFAEVVGRLAEREPDNAYYRQLVATGHERHAEALEQTGDYEVARARVQQALDIAESLAAADADDVLARQEVARLQTALARVEIAAGGLAAARRTLETAQASYAALRDDQPHNMTLRRGMADTLHQRSRALAGLGEHEAALDAAAEALAVAPRPSATLLRDLAWAHHLNGDDATATATLEQAARRLETERGPHVEPLRRTLEADRSRYR